MTYFDHFVAINRKRGMGAIDCNSLDSLIPSTPNYANCAPTDSNCVAGNQQLNVQTNNQWQAYHDAVASCSASNYAASGGSITPSAFTYGAGTDYYTQQAYTAPTAPLATFVAAEQPYQLPAQIAATTAAVIAQSSAPSLMYKPTASVAPTVNSATSGGKAVFNFVASNYTVGSGWQLVITGAAPNSPVSVSSTQNGASAGSQTFGSTGSDGGFVLNGTFDASTVGTWNENWYVGGVLVGNATFTVTVPVAQSTTQTSNPTGTNTSNTTNTTQNTLQTTQGTSTTVASGSGTDFLTTFFSEGFAVGGYTIPYWTLAAGVVVLFMMNSGRR